ncbi:hypothetical protein XMV225_000813 [Aliiroseovarius sp. xm-v-225]|nr:hypothetical protein [Aliiroseovarius sp. xm-m-378]NRP64528.1 hypothetical protein [Aliiroseovarius sp. xm-v-225]NRP91589.1 hypothetical protein [Aliiroseovarius sp. xm-a-134]
MTSASIKPTHSYPPLGLRRVDAARYVGVGATKFDEMVKDGRMPPPRVVDRAKVWNREELKSAFEELPAATDLTGNVWDTLHG